MCVWEVCIGGVCRGWEFGGRGGLECLIRALKEEVPGEVGLDDLLGEFARGAGRGSQVG